MKTGNLWQDFEWRRAAGGYEWREVNAGLLLMVPKQDDGMPLRTVAYRPLSKDHAGLFILFAALKPEPDAVLEFANRYGQLGYPLLAHVWGGKPVALLPALGPFDVFPIAEHGVPGGRSYPGLVGEFLTLPDNPDWQRRSTWAAQIRMLSEYRQMHLLLRSVPDVAPSLQATVNLALQETVGPFVSWSAREQSFRLRLWPSSLIGALWLQAALALARPLAIRKCPVCGTPIEISRSGGARTDAVFCSTKCKSQDYRQRKTNAKKLARRKLAPSQIAKRLRTDETTVRGWLK